MAHPRPLRSPGPAPHRRRVVVATATLALTCGLIALPVLSPAWAAPRPVPPSVREVALNAVDQPAQPGDAPRSAAPANSTLLTGELGQAPFGVAGVALPDGAPPDTIVQVRIREQGAWSSWQRLALLGGPDPAGKDAAHAGKRVATEPIAAAHGDGIQVRIDWAPGHRAPRASALLIDPGRSPADTVAATQPGSRATASTLAPALITRAQWGADESLRPCGDPSYVATIKVGFVHHTVTTNTYLPADSAGIVRGIYAYHILGNGWCDIGYNFLADKYGQIFEGRFGGPERAVLGAHTGGFNNNSFAVSALGDYQTATPSTALLAAISKVMGWKLGLHNRDPLGTATLVSAGGPNTKWPAGQTVSYNVVSGHRDAGNTDCPGALLYPLLSTVRRQAAAYKQANSKRDEDLYGTLLTGTSTKNVEVHANGSGTAYQSRMLAVATQWSQKTPEDWRILVGSYSGDTRPDLIGLHVRNTDSGFVELRVATWASGYQVSEILDQPLPFPAQPPEDPFQFAIGGPSGGDLYLVKTRDTESQRIELHALSAASAYREWSLHVALPLAAGSLAAVDQVRYLVSRGGSDLYLIIHQGTGSGRSELHRLSASSGYQTFTSHVALPAGYTTDRTVQWQLGTAAEPDLFLLLLDAAASGRQEVHRLSAATSWTQWNLHSATDLPMVPFPTWQAGLG